MAFTVLENVSQDELNWYHETRYWMHVSDELTMKNAAKREGRAEGIAEGKQQKAVEIARKMIKNGINTEIIIECTNLSQEEIQILLDETVAEKA